MITTPPGQEIPYDDQFFGTREQVGILYRLAVADLVATSAADPGVCLMLDDPLGHTDRGRRGRMLGILDSEAARRGQQILILTFRGEDLAGVGQHIDIAATAARE